MPEVERGVLQAEALDDPEALGHQRVQPVVRVRDDVRRPARRRRQVVERRRRRADHADAVRREMPDDRVQKRGAVADVLDHVQRDRRVETETAIALLDLFDRHRQEQVGRIELGSDGDRAGVRIDAAVHPLARMQGQRQQSDPLAAADLQDARCRADQRGGGAVSGEDHRQVLGRVQPLIGRRRPERHACGAHQ
ncbi:MAG TPA: hypothetical protein VE953_16445 [Terriglobales bacterium]|nr:hypothetical protein [Terriglobales bacterium]